MAELLKGKTTTGFEYQVNPDDLNDMELVEKFAEVDENPLKLPKVISAVLGDAQKKACYDHHRAENGRIPIDVISAAFVEILSTNNQGKN